LHLFAMRLLCKNWFRESTSNSQY